MARKKKGIFYEPPYYKKYSEIVRMDTPTNARNSAKELVQEAEKAKRPSKIRRIIHVLNLAANRAKAARKRKNLSPKERHELVQIENIYRSATKKVQKIYQRKK